MGLGTGMKTNKDVGLANESHFKEENWMHGQNWNIGKAFFEDDDVIGKHFKSNGI